MKKGSGNLQEKRKRERLKNSVIRAREALICLLGPVIHEHK